MAKGLFLTVFALLLVASRGEAATGIDTFGYQWRDQLDGAVREAPVWDAGYTSLVLNPDAPGDLSANIPLPFTFVLYGVPCTTFHVSANGWIGFNGLNPDSAPLNRAIPNAQVPQLIAAPLWDDATIINEIQYGMVNGGTAFRIYYSAVFYGGPPGAQFEVLLFRDNRIKFQYPLGRNTGSSTIGIENETGSIGSQVLFNSLTGTDGFTLPDGSFDVVVEFIPPKLLRCGSAIALACPSTQGYTLPATAPLPNARVYNCGTKDYSGYEKVFTLNISSLTNFTASISGFTGDLDLFLLSACDETRCLMGGGDSINAAQLGTGVYYLVVDGTAPTASQPFTLTVDCVDASQPLACETPTNGNTVAGNPVMNGYVCTTENLNSPEVLYEVTLPAPGNLVATLTNANVNLDVLIFPSTNVTPGGCIEWGDTTAGAYNLPAGNYIVAVDGRNLFAGPFTLEVECGIKLDCSNPVGTVNCGQTLTTQSTAGGPTNVNHYSCTETTYSGPEAVYRLNVATPSDVVVRLLNADPGTGAFLLTGCDEGDCTSSRDTMTCSPDLQPGQYYIVVDSSTGSPVNFDLQVTCAAPFNRWAYCEDPRAPTTVATTAADHWYFTDQDYCITNPGHRNFAMGHCTFAMYAVAECGTKMHTPLYDVESGDLRVFNLQTDQYEWLTAVSTGGWNASGTELQWQDCPGSDPLWNNQTNDISFVGAPTVCGVYRMEFIDWGGFVWDLFCNCTGTNSPGFQIYDSLCEAMENYDPLPELSLSNIRLSGSCPNYTVSFDVTNVGCMPTSDVEVYLESSVTPGDITNITVPGSLMPGQMRSDQVSLTVTALVPQSLILTADRNDGISECSESGGSAVACDVEQGAHAFTLPICTDCIALPRLAIVPPTICYPSATTLDATGSSIPSCGADPVEYRFHDGANLLRDWLSGPGAEVYTLAPAQYPATDTTYTVEIRCLNRPACGGTAQASVQVELRPDFVNVAAIDVSRCTTEIELSWDPAVWHDASNSGVYNIYRSETACPDPAVDVPIFRGFTGTTFTDITTAPNATYYYMVEAEDGSTNGPCPQGPNNTGAVTGVCLPAILDFYDDQPIADPPQPWNLNAPQPLRGKDKGDDWVTWQWPTWPMPEPGGNFVMYRSQSVSGPFIEVTPVGGVTTTEMTDTNAPAILYYYDLRFRDECGNVSNDWEPPTIFPPAVCSNVDLLCGVPVKSTTVAPCTSRFASHTCFPRPADGADRIHAVRLKATSDLFAELTDLTTDLDVYIYDSRLTQCLTWGDTQATLFAQPPGLYYVVVDSAAGAEGSYTMTATCP